MLSHLARPRLKYYWGHKSDQISKFRYLQVIYYGIICTMRSKCILNECGIYAVSFVRFWYATGGRPLPKFSFDQGLRRFYEIYSTLMRSKYIPQLWVWHLLLISASGTPQGKTPAQIFAC